MEFLKRFSVDLGADAEFILNVGEYTPGVGVSFST